MNKKILIVYGHPAPESYCLALAQQYEQGAKDTGAQVKFLSVRDLDFAVTLKQSYLGKEIKLEKDLLKTQELMSWADHYVFVYPTFWSTMPALMKGFVERVFTPGFAYNFVKGKSMPKKHLKGKSARIIVTMDAPPLYYKCFLIAPGDRMFKQGTLKFCGVNPVRISHIGSVKMASENKKQSWLKKAYRLGRLVK